MDPLAFAIQSKAAFASSYGKSIYDSNSNSRVVAIKEFDEYSMRPRKQARLDPSATTNNSSTALILSTSSTAVSQTTPINHPSSSSSLSSASSTMPIAPPPSMSAELAEMAMKGSQAIIQQREAADEAKKPTWHAPWELMRVISGHQGWVETIAVDPTNEWFASGSVDRTIKIWDLASGALKLTLTGHISPVRSLAVSSRHPYLFSASEDKHIFCSFHVLLFIDYPSHHAQAGISP